MPRRYSRRTSPSARKNALSMRSIPFTFRSFEEPDPGANWQALFEAAWPAYRDWFLSEGEEGRSLVRDVGPHAEGAHARASSPCSTSGWSSSAGFAAWPARMLAIYRPPPYLAACSQGVWTREGDPGARAGNYDYAPSRLGGLDLAQPAARAPGVRDERRVVGPARRDERLGARRLAHLRRPARARREQVRTFPSWSGTSWRRARRSTRRARCSRGSRTTSRTTSRSSTPVARC